MAVAVAVAVAVEAVVLLELLRGGLHDELLVRFLFVVVVISLPASSCPSKRAVALGTPSSHAVTRALTCDQSRLRRMVHFIAPIIKMPRK